MIAGTLEVQLLANMARLQSDMNAAKGVVAEATAAMSKQVASIEAAANKAGNAVTSFAKSFLIGAAATASLAAIQGKIQSVIASMAHLKEVSEKTGASVENLSKLSFVAKSAGSDIDSVATAMGKLSKGLVGADDETKGAGAAMKFLGLSAKDAAGNLKDPAQMYTEIAKKLGEYEDGMGKAAIAQVFFGKAGIEQLPTLKLLAESGDQVAKVTTAQAEAAQRYTRDIMKLEAAKGALYKTIAVALLPTLTDLSGAMLDAAQKTSTAASAAKGLAEDNTIQSWADAGAMGVARLIDVIKTIPELLSAVAGSFKVVYADIEVLGKAAVLTNPTMAAASILKGGHPLDEFKAQLAERNKILADANAKYDKLWNGPKNATEQAMAGRIAGRNTSGENSIDAVAAALGGQKKKLNYDTSNETRGPADDSAYKAAIARQEGLFKIEERSLRSHLDILASEHQRALVGDFQYEDKRYQMQIDSLDRRLGIRNRELATAKAAGKAPDVAKFQTDIDALNDQKSDAALKHGEALYTIEHQIQAEISRIDVEEMKRRNDLVGAFTEEFSGKYSDMMMRAQLDGNVKLQEAIERAWTSGLASANFDQTKQKFDAAFSDMTYQLEKASNAALSDGGLEAAINAQGIAASISNQAIPALMALQQELLAAATKANDLAKIKVAIDLGKSIENEVRKMEGFASNTANAWRKTGDDIATALTNAFGRGGAALGGMIKAQTDYQATQVEINARLASVERDKSLTQDQYERQRQSLQQQSTQAQIASYGNMADAAAGYFDKQSTGYKALHAAAQVFHAAELAMMLAKMVQQGISAVLNQGQGDPYTAFARMAAMAAVVTGLGVAISASGAGSQQEDVAKKAQATQGSGTVLGDSAAKSASVVKSLEMLGSNSNIALKYTSQMVMSLHNIEAGIGGLANLIFRTSGLTTGANMGIQTGKLNSNTGDPILGMFGINDSSLTKNLPIIGGIVSKLQSLWGNSSQSIVDSGLQVKGSLNDLQNGSGVNQYANVERKDTSWFGLVKDFSYSTQYQQASSEIASQFAKIFTNVGQAVTAAGGALSKDAAGIKDQLQNLTIDMGNVSLKDLKGQDLVDALNGVVSKASDEVAKAALPGLEKFQQVGEGYFQTAMRVSAGVETAKAALDKVGMFVGNVYDLANTQGDVAAELVRRQLSILESTPRLEYTKANDPMAFVIKEDLSGVGEIIKGMSGSVNDLIDVYKSLIEVRRIMAATNTNAQNSIPGGTLTQATVAGAGGLDALAAGAKDFLDKFYTDAEKVKIETAKVSDEFMKLGYHLPQSKDEFRKLLTGIDQTTESGQRLYGSLITLSSSFADLMDKTGGVNSAIADQIKRVDQLSTDAQRWLSIRASAGNLQNTITTSIGNKANNDPRMEELWSMLSLGGKVDPEQQIALATELLNLIVEKYKVEKDNANDLLSAAKNLRTYLDSLNTGDLSPSTNTEKLNAAQAQYEATLQKAQGGDKEASGDLQNKAETYLKLARDYYASSDPYKSIFASVYNSLDQFAIDTLSAADLQETANGIAQGQLDELSKLRDIVAGIDAHADTQYTAVVNQLQASVNVLQMLNTSMNVLSTVPDLLRGLPAELAARLQQMPGGIATAGGSANDQAAIAAAATQAEKDRIAAAQAAAAQTASGSQQRFTPTPFYQLSFQSAPVDGSHANGLSNVPFDGYIAELHKNERVLTAAENQSYRGKGGDQGDSAELVAEIRALRDEVAQHRRDQNAQTGALIAAGYDANERAADKIVQGTNEAADSMAWKQTSKAALV